MPPFEGRETKIKYINGEKVIFQFHQSKISHYSLTNNKNRYIEYVQIIIFNISKVLRHQGVYANSILHSWSTQLVHNFIWNETTLKRSFEKLCLFQKKPLKNCRKNRLRIEVTLLLMKFIDKCWPWVFCCSLSLCTFEFLLHKPPKVGFLSYGHLYHLLFDKTCEVPSGSDKVQQIIKLLNPLDIDTHYRHSIYVGSKLRRSAKKKGINYLTHPSIFPNIKENFTKLEICLKPQSLQKWVT